MLLLKMEKQYWFYIDSFVHISVKKDALLFYNPYTGKFIEYYGKKKVSKLVKRLQAPRNLGVVLLKASELEDHEISEFVNTIREYFMGDLIDTEFSEGKPVQMPRVIKIQKDVKYLKKDDSRTVGEGVMDYLSEVSLYINDRCEQNCVSCSSAYRQFRICTANKKKNLSLDMNVLDRFFMEIKSCSLSNINILGGDIFAFPELDSLIERISAVNYGTATFFQHYLNIAGYKDELRRLKALESLCKLAVTFPVDENKLNAALDAVNDAGLETTPYFVIENETDIDKAETLVQKFTIGNFSFQPYFNGYNPDFFEDNVFIDREDIEEARPVLKDIYTRSTINFLNFGRLTVLPNGRVHANINESGLGIIGKDSVYEILIKEMETGKSWRKIRKNVSPCKSCLFENLCPPISNYSTGLGRYDLCTIRQKVGDGP
ncbi:MAG: TIGR04150 pseudo-rSAM protein [bacterium]|nr:TIGR04150 pseudo-rSAM protein [bacterium]